MGIVHRGIPWDRAVSLLREYSLKYFVETGTLVGNTAELAAPRFEQVYTVEIAYKYHIIARKKLDKYPNVQTIFGDSVHVLEGLVPKLEKPTLFWLDAHWSKDLGYNPSDASRCPVIHELVQISKAELPHVVLIDDVRLFGVEKGWPTVDVVISMLESMNKSVYIENDVFVATPNGEV